MYEQVELPLRQLARYAAQHAIKGTSFKRNSLLKPLDIILEQLDKCVNPDDHQELAEIQAAVKILIFEHIARIAKEGYKPGNTKRSKIDHYVDLFFRHVFLEEHRGNVNRLLAREKLLRAAYLFWVREAWAEIFVARGKAKDVGSASDQMEERIDDDEDNSPESLNN